MKRVEVIDAVAHAVLIAICSVPIAMTMYFVAGYYAGFPLIFGAACSLYLLLTARNFALYQPTLTTACGLITIAGAVLVLPSSSAIVAAVGTLWIWRITVRRASFRQAALDAAVVFVALLFAAVASMVSGSAVLSIWCFFLLQSLAMACYTAEEQNEPATEERFWQAERQARRALAAIAS